MTVREWQDLCAKLGSQDNWNQLRDDLGGPSPGGAAAELGVSRQRVHQLIEEGKLDVVELRETKWSRPHVIMVTETSLRRWRASRPGAQQDLPLTPIKPKRSLPLRPGKRG